MLSICQKLDNGPAKFEKSIPREILGTVFMCIIQSICVQTVSKILPTSTQAKEYAFQIKVMIVLEVTTLESNKNNFCFVVPPL